MQVSFTKTMKQVIEEQTSFDSSLHKRPCLHEGISKNEDLFKILTEMWLYVLYKTCARVNKDPMCQNLKSKKIPEILFVSLWANNGHKYYIFWRKYPPLSFLSFLT